MRRIHDRLAEVAEELLGPGVAGAPGGFQRGVRLRRGPRSEAKLRRAISTAYYALFHLLTYEATRKLAGRTPVAAEVRRWFEHREMVKVAKHFLASGTKPQRLQPLLRHVAVSADLRIVAMAFKNLHQWREHADYDIDKKVDKRFGERAVTAMREALQAWNRVRTQPDGQAFVAALAMFGGRRLEPL